MIAGNGHLFLERVAVELDDLHAVQQWARNSVHNVGRRNEQDIREVEVYLQVVIAEGMVLGRIEHLQQRRRRVTPPVAADFVDLVQHDHRIQSAGFLERAGDTARQCADIRPAVTADLRLVVDPAQRDACETPPEGAGNRFPQRRLADARWANQGDDCA